MPFILPSASPAKLGLHASPLRRMRETIAQHIADNRYPGAQIALARDGRLVLEQAFGKARLGTKAQAAGKQTLWLMYSQTKVLTAAAIWVLAENGAFRYTDRVADILPGFAAGGKGDITLFHVLSHQGGFPDAEMPDAAWDDHDLMRRSVCAFPLQWEPGSRCDYHPEAAHWVLAAVIEAATGRDYRDVIRDAVTKPLGLEKDLYVGVPKSEFHRIATLYEPDPGDGAQRPRGREDRPEFWRAGVPGGGGYGTARGLAAFYQVMLAGGTLRGRRLVSQRTIEYVTRVVTGDRTDAYMGMPMHRGLGVHLRGLTPTIRGLGTLASPRTYGHGGVGTSYSWGDPESGVSFSFISNSRVPDPWHSRRLDIISNFAHAAIGPRKRRAT